MSNELESDIAKVMDLESFGVDGVGYDETETEPPSSTNPQSGSIMFQVTEIVRFLLEPPPAFMGRWLRCPPEPRRPASSAQGRPSDKRGF